MILHMLTTSSLSAFSTIPSPGGMQASGVLRTRSPAGASPASPAAPAAPPRDFGVQGSPGGAAAAGTPPRNVPRGTLLDLSV